MNISQTGLELIKKYEGCRLKSYKCPAGVWTIGYGHTAGVKEGQTITQAQAEQYLKEDMVKYEGYVEKYVSLTLNQNQFDALVSFTYNCGAGNLQKLVKNRNHAQIAEALTLYNKATGKVLPGLVKRRAEEKALFLAPCQSCTGATNSGYVIGKNYTLQNNMYIRDAAAGNKKKFLKLTTNAKSHAYEDSEKNGILKKGTVVTCKGIDKVGNATWMKIPSGWVCAVNSDGTIYIK